MIRIALLTLLLSFNLLGQEEPPTPPERSTTYRARHDIVNFGGNVKVGTNDTAHDVVVIGGTTELRGDVHGETVIIGGKVLIDTVMSRDVVCVGADVVITTNATFQRDAVFVGGTINEAEGVIYERGKEYIPIPLPAIHLQWLQDWMQYGLFLGRPLPHQLVWAWVVAGIFLVIYLLTGAIFKGTTSKAAANLVEKPMQSFGFGLLTLILIGPLLFLLAISIVGLLAIPFLICGIVVVCLIGKAAVLQAMGSRLGVGNSSLLAILVGGLLLAVIYAVPILGFIAFGMATVMGLGSVLMPLFAGKPMTPIPIPPQQSVPPFVPMQEQVIPPAVAVIPTSTNEATYAPAGFWLKFAGAFLDLLVITVFTAITTFPPAGLLLWLAYNAAFWATKGTTLGGMVVGIKAVRLDGTKLTFAVATVRALSSVLSLMPFCLGFIWSAWDSRKQTWHDKIAGTIVVKVPSGVSLL